MGRKPYVPKNRLTEYFRELYLVEGPSQKSETVKVWRSPEPDEADKSFVSFIRLVLWAVLIIMLVVAAVTGLGLVSSKENSHAPKAKNERRYFERWPLEDW